MIVDRTVRMGHRPPHFPVPSAQQLAPLAVLCTVHTATPSTTACARCRKPICGHCDALCATCVWSRERSRRLGKTALRLLAVAAVGVGLFFGWKKLDALGERQAAAASAEAAAKESAKRIAERDADLQPLADDLAKEPCDHRLANEYVSALFKHGHARRAVDAASAFFRRCGDDDGLAAVAYSADRQLGENDAAVDVASKLIASSPQQATYWAWRAFAYDAKGDLVKAVDDYQKALVLEPDANGVAFHLALARDLERLDRPCEAIAPLENLVAHGAEIRGIETVTAQIDALYALPRCAGLQSEGVATIRIARDGMIHTDVVLNGKTKVRMLVDTGASTVILSRKVAERMKIDVDHLPTVTVSTAGGLRQEHVTTLDSVSVQGLRLTKVPAGIIDDMEADDALLGQSFLSRYKVTIDRRAGKMELRGRKTK